MGVHRETTQNQTMHSCHLLVIHDKTLVIAGLQTQ